MTNKVKEVKTTKCKEVLKHKERTSDYKKTTYNFHVVWCEFMPVFRCWNTFACHGYHPSRNANAPNMIANMMNDIESGISSGYSLGGVGGM